jgi:hypothetical protein
MEIGAALKKLKPLSARSPLGHRHDTRVQTSQMLLRHIQDWLVQPSKKKANVPTKTRPSPEVFKKAREAGITLSWREADKPAAAAIN